MTVWVTYYYEVGPMVEGIYAAEIDARRGVDGYAQRHVIEVPLPCADFTKYLNSGQKMAPPHGADIQPS